VTLVSDQPLSITNAPLIRGDAKQLPKPESIAGKAVLVEESGSTLQTVLGQLASGKPLVVLVIDRFSETGRGLGRSRLVDPENTRQTAPQAPTVVRIHDSKLGPFVDALAAGRTDARITMKLGGKTDRPIKVKNVVGLLRGSDPILRNTYVLLTAHYDHIGIRPELEGDKIFNGANDDGSGTVSVIEVAAALARTRPKRSIVFMTFFGEEAGLLGSRYYGRHPVFPLKDTVADINLEQVGRTDSTEGSQVNRATLTGFDYSDLGPIFKRAGEVVGIEVYKHERNSDAFFGRSDNQALADAGIPSHTLCVAFEFPDYHRPGDHWEKIDFPNLARTTRMVALAVLAIGNSDEAPKWNTANPRTARYVAAAQKLKESQ
jgi:Peptidase family M28